MQSGTVESARLRALPPSVTTWTRIEPKPRDATLAKSLQGQVRDPAWMLARQWQVGEFMGEDAGSPIQATLGVENRTLTTYRPGSNPVSTVAIDPALPLEIHVEREPVILGLRAAVQLGLWFERKLRNSGVSSAIVNDFRLVYPISPATDDDVVYDGGDGSGFRQLTLGRVCDGLALFRAATGDPTAPALPSSATTNPTVAAVLASFVAYRKKLYSEPNNDRAWQPQQLAYDFAVGSPISGDALALDATGFGGGHLDWYDFQLGANQGTATNLPLAAISEETYSFLPQHVVFRGMPDPRWWTFESAVTDFGSLDAEPVDLAKLLVMEFALTYGNDWFIVKIPTPVGMLSTVTTLVVSDTFGQRTLIRSSEDTKVNPGELPWSMFKISAATSRSSFILIPPSLGITDEGPTMERVNFIRDDMAAMAWAVEHELHGTLDHAVDAYQAYLARVAKHPVPKPTPQDGDPAIFYTLESAVPDNWIPLVPVQTKVGQLVFRRGLLERWDGTQFVPNPAHASILEPGVPFYLTDRIITRIGTFGSVGFRRSRGTDGTSYLWEARRSQPGAGPGWSGLRFDFLQRFDEGAANP
jgi:hypothetical protein